MNECPLPLRPFPGGLKPIWEPDICVDHRARPIDANSIAEVALVSPDAEVKNRLGHVLSRAIIWNITLNSDLFTPFFRFSLLSHFSAFGFGKRGFFWKYLAIWVEFAVLFRIHSISVIFCSLSTFDHLSFREVVDQTSVFRSVFMMPIPFKGRGRAIARISNIFCSVRAHD
jgi:hypothetical protein